MSFIVDFYAPKGSSIVSIDDTYSYSCTLNQTCINVNSNKYYKIQLLKVNNSYGIFTRYGRIGEEGNYNLEPCSNLSSSISKFKSLFRSKTKNNWDDRENFTHYSGKYFITDCGKIKTDANIISEESAEDDDLDDQIVDFIQLITDKDMLMESMVRSNINTDKLPLGKLETSQLEKAKNILKIIKKGVEKDENKEYFEKLSSEYYTLIPTVFGRRKPKIIDNYRLIESLDDTLDTLKNILISYQGGKRLKDIYSNMKVSIEPLHESDIIRSQIQSYLNNSQAPTHFFRLEFINVLRVSNPFIKERFYKNHNDKDNHQLLIHGSPLCNWVSILSNGLMLDPSKIGAKITGKMFGYGIYWANCFTKSAQYCGASDGEAICFTLARVALGNEKKLYSACPSMCKSLLDKYDSVWGVGSSGVEEMKKIQDDNLLIPDGKIMKRSKYSSLLYDEKIIYDETQYNFEYMVIARIRY